jgi:hypothetical protein
MPYKNSKSSTRCRGFSSYLAEKGKKQGRSDRGFVSQIGSVVSMEADRVRGGNRNRSEMI